MKDAMKKALEALEDAKTHGLVYVNEIVDLRQAIAEAEKQEERLCRGKEHMTRNRKAHLHIITLPFVISAAVEFLPAWVYWPIALIGGMAWFGACVILIEKEQK